MSDTLLHMTGFQMKHGDSVEVEGGMKPSTVGFAIGLGVDPANKAVYFNPKFSQGGCKIILNNMVNSIWQDEVIEECQPCNKDIFTVLIKFCRDNFEIVVCNKNTLKFPNRSGMDILKAFWIDGDIRVKSVKFNIQIN